MVSRRYKYILHLPSNLSFFYHHNKTTTNKQSKAKQLKPKQLQHSINTFNRLIQNQPKPNKPINNMSSFRSASSSTSTSTSTPFRSVYAKDARGHDLSDAYARKYGSSTVSSSPIPIPSINRLVYAKDARGVALSPSSYEAEEYEAIKTNPIVGDDGMPRNPYDHGQRERSLGYWAEVRSVASSVRSSSTSFMSTRSK